MNISAALKIFKQIDCNGLSRHGGHSKEKVVGSILLVLQLPPPVSKHACEVNWERRKLPVGVCERECLVLFVCPPPAAVDVWMDG